MTIISAATIRQLPRLLAFGLGLFLAGLPASASNQPAWEPIAPEDLAATECKAYPGSSAEVLLDRQTVATSVSDQICYFYRQTKIYSAKGAIETGILKIEHAYDLQVWDVAARLTKPNGSVTEYSKKDLIESVAAKIGNIKLKVLTLVLSDLGAGDVLEMRWTEALDRSFSSYHWRYLQDVIPVRHFLFTVNESMEDCLLQAFNLPAPRVKAAETKKTQIEVFDLPPFLAEPQMPPERDMRGWFILLYTPPHMRYRSESDLWVGFSKYWEEQFRGQSRPNAEIKAKAAELLAGAVTDEEKLRRLYEFCRNEISNLDYFDSEKIQKVQKKIANDIWEQTAAQTIARKGGKKEHINALFAALARAAGYEVRLALSSSRGGTLQVRNMAGWAFMRDQLVAVRLQNVWKLYSPGDYFVPPGMLSRLNEGAISLICDTKQVLYETNPVSAAAKSPVKRQGRFTVDADGNLEGDVEIFMDGHEGISQKQESLGVQEAVIDAGYRARLAQRLPGAEVEGLRWENLSGTKLPVIVRYHLKVPAYADLAGSKMILPVNVFEHGAPVVFSAESRKYSIYFDHAWREEDEIEITLPAGFGLESGGAPDAVGDLGKILGVNYTLSYVAESRRILYERKFALGGNGTIACKAVSYPVLKALFEEIQHGNEHTVLLKPENPAVKAATASGAQAKP